MSAGEPMDTPHLHVAQSPSLSPGGASAPRERFKRVRAAARRLESFPTLNRLIRPVLLWAWDLAWQPSIRIRMLRGGPLAVLDLDIGQFTVDLRDKGLAWPLYRYREYEPSERRVMERLVTPGMQVVDIGAHFGYHTRLLAGLIGETGRIVAIEAEPDNFVILERNLEGDAGRNVIAVNVAASDRETRLKLAIHPSNRGMHHIVSGSTDLGTITVPARTVDEIVADFGLQPRFIKMDIEGAEMAALLGMSRLLEADELTFLAELNASALDKAGTSSDALLAHFADRGFHLYSLESGGRLRRTDPNSLLKQADRAPNISFVAAKGRAALSRILEANKQ